MKDLAANQSESKFREQCRDELIPGCPHCLYKLPPFGHWTERGLTRPTVTQTAREAGETP